MKSSALAVIFALFLLQHAQFSAGLSYPVCDTIGEEFTTSAPRLEGEWPYYSLLYTCSGNLNLEGFAVDSCVLNGTKCGQAAADAFCQYLGFDYNAPGLFTTITATAPAISLTGEWCTSPGQYADFGHPNRTQFEGIKAANAGPFCTSLNSVTCIRTRASMRQSVPSIALKAASAPASSPQISVGSSPALVNPATLSAGRRSLARRQ